LVIPLKAGATLSLQTHHE